MELAKAKAEAISRQRDQDNADRDAAEQKAAELGKEAEKTFAEEVAKRRTMFLGRIAQQARLAKRNLQVTDFACKGLAASSCGSGIACAIIVSVTICLFLAQIERNKREYYWAMWKHLLSDCEEELRLQQLARDDAKRRRRAASAASDTLRGQEKGARAAAARLKDVSLLDASADALKAAERFCKEAAEEEGKARQARADEEDAIENVERELEKKRACEVQLWFNRMESKKVLDDLVDMERVEILKVVAEEDFLLEQRIFFVDCLNSAAPLSGTAKSYQDDVDRIDRRLALLAMEQEMFRPMYTQPTASPSLLSLSSKAVNIFLSARLAALQSASSREVGVQSKRFETREVRQPPGTVCLGCK